MDLLSRDRGSAQPSACVRQSGAATCQVQGRRVRARGDLAGGPQAGRISRGGSPADAAKPGRVFSAGSRGKTTGIYNAPFCVLCLGAWVIAAMFGLGLGFVRSKHTEGSKERLFDITYRAVDQNVYL